MRNKRWMMGGGAVLSAAAVIMIVPTSRHHVLGTLRGEASQNGKYLSQWIDQLADPDDDTRREAVDQLGNLNALARPALPDLVRVMRQDQDERIRSMAAFSVYKIASDMKRHGDRATEALDGLIAALQDEKALVRMNATLGLGTLGADAQKALPQLQAGIKRQDNDVRVLWFTTSIREQMIVTLGLIGPDAKEAVGLLEEMLRDPEPSMRRQSIQALGKIGPAAKQAVPALIAVINDESEPGIVHDLAREALKQVDPEAAAKLAKE
jgi:HEAT repeat protein